MHQDAIFEFMGNPSSYDPVPNEVKRIDTHAAVIFLAGSFAYKIKRAVRLSYLDFSTLEKRKFFCEEELRLNRRLASDMYLDVVSVHGTPEHPVVDGTGPLLEYAVKMRQFATADRMDNVTERGELTPGQIDQLALVVSEFHEHIPVAANDSPFGTIEVIRQRIMQNFEQVLQNTDDPEISSICSQLRDWSEAVLKKRQHLIAQRKQEGAVRECHGDMHMANIVMLEGRPVIYDCLEFAEDLRWIDTISEIAFLYMDLDFHHQHKLALRYLNQYMIHRGDYAGLGLLCIYLVKVHILQCHPY